MVRFTGWLAHLDTPTVDRRVLVMPVDGVPDGPVEVPVRIFGFGVIPRAVGVIRRVWTQDDGWLRGEGELNLGALPPAYQVPRVGAEIDVEVYNVEDVVRGDDVLLVVNGWQLRAVTIGDRPAWPDARLELEL